MKRVFKKDRTGLLNDVFTFRLDRSVENSDEAIVWGLIEESESKGVGLREFIVEQVLTAQQIEPHKTDRKTVVAQLRREMQRLSVMVQQLQNIRIVTAGDNDNGLENTPDEILENVKGMLDNMTEYGEE